MLSVVLNQKMVEQLRSKLSPAGVPILTYLYRSPPATRLLLTKEMPNIPDLDRLRKVLPLDMKNKEYPLLEVPSN